MSHLVAIKTEVRDVAALRSACRRLALPTPTKTTAQLFSTEANGHCVRLPGWRYPVVCDLETGELAFDHFEGRWGDPHKLDQLLQAYAVERAGIEARRRGHTVTEQTLHDGSIKLTIQVGERQ